MNSKNIISTKQNIPFRISIYKFLFLSISSFYNYYKFFFINKQFWIKRVHCVNQYLIFFDLCGHVVRIKMIIFIINPILFLFLYIHTKYPKISITVIIRHNKKNTRFILFLVQTVFSDTSEYILIKQLSHSNLFSFLLIIYFVVVFLADIKRSETP